MRLADHNRWNRFNAYEKVMIVAGAMIGMLGWLVGITKNDLALMIGAGAMGMNLIMWATISADVWRKS